MIAIDARDLVRAGTQTVPLTDGVGVITATAPAQPTIQVVDGNGSTLAQLTVAEPDAVRRRSAGGTVRRRTLS